MSLWDDVARDEYDAFAWLGDAVYADERVRVGIRGSERVYNCLLYTSPSPRD